MKKYLIDTLEQLLATGTVYATENKGGRTARTAPEIKRTCKDCYFYTGGTFCKRVKHHVNKQTPANKCGWFKKK